jgi:hypothetical protein
MLPNWYFTERDDGKISQIGIEISETDYQDSIFDSLGLARKYENLMSRTFTTGFFRTDSSPGPFLLVRADECIEAFKDCPLKIIFSFNKFPSGGLIGIF